MQLLRAPPLHGVAAERPCRSRRAAASAPRRVQSNRRARMLTPVAVSSSMGALCCSAARVHRADARVPAAGGPEMRGFGSSGVPRAASPAGAFASARGNGGPTLKGRRASAAADAAASSSEARRLLNLQQYAELKTELLKNTALVGTGLAGYLTLAQHDAASGVSVLVGVAGSLAYLALLCRHVDGLGKGGNVRGLKLQRKLSENVGAVLLGAVQRVGDVYWCALVLTLRRTAASASLAVPGVCACNGR